MKVNEVIFAARSALERLQERDAKERPLFSSKLDWTRKESEHIDENEMRDNQLLRLRPSTRPPGLALTVIFASRWFRLSN